MANCMAGGSDRCHSRTQYVAILEHGHLAGVDVRLDRSLCHGEERLEVVRRLCGNLFRCPEIVIGAIDQHRSIGEGHEIVGGEQAVDMVWMKMGDDDDIDVGRIIPAAARFFGIRPTVGPNSVEVPVSTRTRLSPVLTTHSLTDVGVLSFGRNAPSSSLPAPAGSPENILASIGSHPSLSTVTSSSPSLKR